MNQITLEVQNADGSVQATSSDHGQAHLVYRGSYVPGDEIVLRSGNENVFLVIQLDDAMDPAFIYMTGHEYRFYVPFNEKKISYSPKSFTGELHVLTARSATEEEINAYKNLALNVYDQHENTACFPHAFANVETRGESVFAARNAINGNSVNFSHGKWPFESWGINQREDAEITVNFGRTVEIDKVALTIRADFPHDNYWERVTLTFSDGSKHTAELVKSHLKQTIQLERKKVEWVTLKELIKSEDPSPFPALSQFEVFGHEVM
ncbi:carbohydrate-binding protein [Paenibacillus dokdonensis]|uniref:Carbohydrate-binding protein n=1 Tax=Paenibacillus dokdonensis TaxID=2567944 RepID=A0ABU6GKR9_9BACL|nr:carbohydrate-binding protein [Paenibacillus dokdonensis]MEC0240303.1 carbohydrate-binding protein [Paenibacillus dokdonensis]